MDKKVIAILAVIVIVAAGAGTFVLLKNNNSSSNKYSMDGAELKVLGNANGDGKIDQADIDLINGYVNDKKEVKDFPLADANNDGSINADDVTIVKKIVAGESTKVWHVNYHDVDGDGVMDSELVSTTFPVKSIIMSGSANLGIMCYLMNIVDEVKGAAYSSTSLDSNLYKNTFRNTTAVEKVGTSATTINIENGKVGTANIIQEKGVTALLSDWNRTYIPNEAKFEDAKVDVIRIASASFDPEVYTHSILLLGFLFQKEDTAKQVLGLYNETFNAIKDGVSGVSKKVKALASSMNGYISSEDSDYTQMLISAGAEYGIPGYNFGGSTSILAADNLSIFDDTKYKYDYIVHVRTTLGYSSDNAQYVKDWADYTAAFTRWENSENGQYLVSGVVPVPIRIAYCAYAMYGDSVSSLSLQWANNLHAKFVHLYPGEYKNIDVGGYQYVIKSNPASTIISQVIEGANAEYNSVEKKFYGKYAEGVSHSLKVVASDSKAVIRYGTTEGVYDLTESPSYEAKGTYTVYYQITSEGKETVTKSFSLTVADAIEYTVENYTGTVDGEGHNIVVKTTTPGATIKYGDSASKCTANTYSVKDEGTTVVYFVITGDGLVSEHGSATVTLTK